MARINRSSEEALASAPIGILMLKLAMPAVAAQVINMLYNIVDRIYIGHIPEVGRTALTGLGITFPIIMLFSAFAAFAGMGGAPLASIRLGAGDRKGAEKILGNSAIMLLVTSVVLTAVFLIFIDPTLTLFGATDVLRPFALEYGFVIGIGLPFMMISAAINSMIRADGSPKYAMFSMVIGAILNVILDPVFISLSST